MQTGDYCGLLSDVSRHPHSDCPCGLSATAVDSSAAFINAGRVVAILETCDAVCVSCHKGVQAPTHTDHDIPEFVSVQLRYIN